MATDVHVKAKNSWKNVDFVGQELSVFDDDAFSGLVSIQELTDYEIFDSKAFASKLKKSSREKKKNEPERKTKKVKKSISENKSTVKLCEDDDSQAVSKHKKLNIVKQRKQNQFEKQSTVEQKQEQKKTGKRKAEESPEAPSAKKKKERQRQVKDKFTKKRFDKTGSSERELLKKEITENDLPGWKGMFVPNVVLKALKQNGFAAPTPIQALALPSAIRDRKDIIGAAETGSGKTLAFGIPLIHHILARKAERKASMSVRDSAPEMDSGIDDQDDDDDGSDVVNSENGSEDDDEDSNGSENENESADDESESDDDGDQNDKGASDSKSESETETEVRQVKSPSKTKMKPKWSKPPLYALVLTPTRELAIQVLNHIKAAAKFTDIQVVNVIGGISVDKQKRLLGRHPEIVVATPGRLWELIQEGQRHLADVPNVQYLVIDEADRMVQKGHFQELSDMLELMNSDEKVKKRRQTFVFSATLTFVHDAPHRFKKKKRLKKLTTEDKIDSLMSRIGIKEKPKVIDLTRKEGTAETLTETKIHCSMADKDVYLYYFLQQHPGRTLIFTNSKDCLRRLLSILTLLECRPLPLHADMHQKQRLKNLERFTVSPNAVLLATDVAARGLDIPNVRHVIHYQVPSTCENYIHRSGRTARASKEGLSFMIIGPNDDLKNYRKILRSLKRQEDIPQLPVELKYLPAVRERLAVAMSIDVEEHKTRKVHNQNNWFVKAAKEMDMELDDDLIRYTGDSMEKADYKCHIKKLRQELKYLLRTPVVSEGTSHKYPTMSGKLVVPYMQDAEAISRVKSTKPLRIPAAPAHKPKKTIKKWKKKVKK